MAQQKVTQNITIEGARIIFRNFSGKEGKYNAPGNRNFCVLLDENLAEDLMRDGWNVRYLRPREQEDEPQAYMQVKVAFGNIPPTVVLITSKGKTRLNEDSLDILDWAEIKNVDLIIRPYNYDVSGHQGVKAYLKSIYVTISEDELESKYMDVPDSAFSHVSGLDDVD